MIPKAGIPISKVCNTINKVFIRVSAIGFGTSMGVCHFLEEKSVPENDLWLAFIPYPSNVLPNNHAGSGLATIPAMGSLSSSRGDGNNIGRVESKGHITGQQLPALMSGVRFFPPLELFDSF